MFGLEQHSGHLDLSVEQFHFLSVQGFLYDTGGLWLSKAVLVHTWFFRCIYSVNKMKPCHAVDLH